MTGRNRKIKRDAKTFLRMEHWKNVQETGETIAFPYGVLYNSCVFMMKVKKTKGEKS